MFARFEFRSSMPSIIVLGLPNFLVSSLMRIRCCSFSISPQTHKSFGSPHVGQTSAMALSFNNVVAIYKSFKQRQVKLGLQRQIGKIKVTAGAGCAVVWAGLVCDFLSIPPLFKV